MSTNSPTSVLFCCDHNAVRSPMAEGLLKKHMGASIYVQSAGVRDDMEIDGFSIAVCDELGVALHRHQSRSFRDMHDGGDALSSFDLVIALSSHSRDEAEDLSRYDHLTIEYWPISDPTATGQTREDKLEAYRKTRDEIIERIEKRFSPAS